MILHVYILTCSECGARSYPFSDEESLFEWAENHGWNTYSDYEIGANVDFCDMCVKKLQEEVNA